jgi:glyoxylase-like metal-dependent hydrolase (beta-lactamase superfamily II)
MIITVERVITGPIETNTYIVINDKSHVLIVDPSSGCDELLSLIKRKNYLPEAVILTHGHFDHHIGLTEILNVFPDLTVYINLKEIFMVTNPEMNGSHMIGVNWKYTGKLCGLDEGHATIGSFEFDVIAVPGHSPNGCAFLFGNHCICGDILFAGSIGRSDLPGGDGELLVEGIKEKLLTLPDETIVCPGHGGRTTIGREKRLNPYLQS